MKMPEFDPEDQINVNEDDITIVELEGEQYEIVDTILYEDKSYVAITPYSEEDDGEGDFTILELVDDPDNEDECILKTVDDEALYTAIGDEFLKRFAEEDE